MLHHGLTDGGGGVELFILGDEGDTEGLQFIVHGGEVNQIAADAVDLPDDEVGKLASADAIHHGLIFGAVGVFG